MPDAACRGETFSLPDDRPELFEWIAARQGRSNIHLTLNEPVARERQRGAAGRVCKADIETIRVVTVDLDPRREMESEPGGFERERTRLFALLSAWREDARGPSAIIDSGGGVQAVWMLREPLKATPENIALVEAQSRALSRHYGGDATHSVEHLFRIPFTINLPNESKRARGRKRAETQGKVFDPPRFHTLEDLARIASPEVEPKALIPASLPDVSLSLGCLGVPENLEEELKERLAAARTQSALLNRLLAAASPSADRSSHDYALAAALVEAGFSDPNDVADVVAAYSPEKTEDRGASYLARTVAKALSGAKPLMPEDFFEAIPGDADPVTAFAEPVDIFGDDDPAELSSPPVGSLPDVIEAFVRTEAPRKGVPESFVAIAAIAAAGGAIGNALTIQPKRHDSGWRVPASLAVVITARPGRKKSPTIAAALAPHRILDREMYSAGTRARAAWEATNKTARGRASAAPATPMPPLRQLLVDDATLEKQVRIHADNPRGVIRAPDELAAFLGSIGAYKRNGEGDRGNMLKLLDGSPVSLDRVGGTVRADSALMGLIASTQPDKIRALARDLGSDGLLQRLIFVVDDGLERPSLDVPPDAAALATYEQAIRAFCSIDVLSGGVVHLSDEARTVIGETLGRVRALERLPGASAAWEGHISKWDGLAFRILLCFHALDVWSFFGSVPVGPGNEVTADTARKAARFIGFLMRHALRFYAEFYEPAEHTSEARWIANWLLTRPEMESVTPREIEKARRYLAGKRRATLSAMRDLENAAWVVTADRSSDGPSRWTINPEIHRRFAERAEREKAHRERERERMLAAMSAKRAFRDES
ncbi:DUF3987 domain-containing protein [Methylobacterium sp. C25]|uniref:DUF3987 domain-containing protein n=1 Tax=Methylobacterium sp. C25 TaxID=2721622 RepID=UPI001F2C6EBE|nr:DUF3987 domain-containing protein [Methylobacterium sp. C25]MCE4226751.1 DUF3987 domain-containing protein [Methylobacterium sp. C25]